MKLCILFILSLVATTSFSADYYSAQYSTITDIEFVEVLIDEDGYESEKIIATQKVPTIIDEIIEYDGAKRGGDILMATKDLIALGKEIYKIIEAGKPVITINEANPVQVLPRREDGNPVEAYALEGWKDPLVKKYRVNTRNYLGGKPASFDFILIYSYGGSHNGVGSYITGAQVVPTAVDVKWGYKLDAAFRVQSIMNQGTVESPIAGAVLMFDYKIWTVLNEKRGKKTFFINGLGKTTVY